MKQFRDILLRLGERVLEQYFGMDRWDYLKSGIFANGTINIAKSMALAYWRGSKTLIGGGDTLGAMKMAGVSESEVSHVSTGGGATLRYLAGDEMPGMDALNKK